MFVGLDDGTVEWHGPDGTLVGTMNTEAKAETGGMAFDAAGSLYVANSGPEGVSKFDANGKLLSGFGSGYNDHPKSIVFDSSGNAYVGQADGGHAVLKFNPDEIELAAVSVPVEKSWLGLDRSGGGRPYSLLHVARPYRETVRHGIRRAAPRFRRRASGPGGVRGAHSAGRRRAGRQFARHHAPGHGRPRSDVLQGARADGMDRARARSRRGTRSGPAIATRGAYAVSIFRTAR